MNRIIRLTLSAAACLHSCIAAHASDRRLDGPAVTAALSEHVLAGDDRGRKTEQMFQKHGTTYYSVDGSQSQGRWQVRGNQYCSQWPPGDGWSCYDVLADGGLIALVAKSGERYPVKPTD